MLIASSSTPSTPSTPTTPASPRESGATLRWPDAERMFEGAWDVDWTRRAKYGLRAALTGPARDRVLDECSRNAFARALLETRPRAFYPLMSHLLDRRFGLEERLEATLASVRAMPVRLGEERARSLLDRPLELLALEDGTRLTLSLSDVSFHEGLLQVGLYSSAGDRLYSLGFGFTSPYDVLVANVQGPSIGRGGLEDNRHVTQAAHGMRPPYLLLRALRACAQAWRSASLAGVDPAHHVKGRWNLRQSRLKFDYRGFWADSGGWRDLSGNWTLPLSMARRPLLDVPARRRAMYRRRYEMLDQLDAQVRGLSR